MTLTPGTRLGVYEITALLGEGGMGQVYRATDTKLKRQVAIKILPPAFAADADRLARFQREAEVLASLNHPNIAAIYGLEESSGMTALVMELIEGDDLSQRIARGAIPLNEALPIAKQIAEALEAAHEQGIVHRDLKPANIKVRADGTVKVLDFGLAKAMETGAGSSPNVTQSPTLTSPATTQAGMILGTAAYMAPEQARGGIVDRRADIWAFGVVLFEMLTGTPLFAGATVSDTLAFVLTKDPDWTTLPAEASAPIRRVLRRCLEKDRKRRLTDAGAARLEIDEALTRPAVEAGQQSTTSRAGSNRVLRIVLAIAVVVIVALTIPAVRYLGEAPPPTQPETRVDIVTPVSDRPSDFALSPDGRQVVFVSSGDGASRLWVRSLATTTAQPLAGTDGGQYPFWSPDGRSIGFFAGGGVKRVDVLSGGGALQTLASAANGNGGSWNTDGVIVFAPSQSSALLRVPATGGAATAVTMLGPQQIGHTAPFFLPDGRRFLFYAFGAPDATAIYMSALDRSDSTRLTPADSSGVYLPPTSVLWVQAGALVAQRLDAAQPALTGQPVKLADGVTVDSLYRTGVSVAATGLVAYRAGGDIQRRLTWFDRSGTPLGTVGEPDATLSSPVVSPDGGRLVVVRTAQGNKDLWLLDGSRTSRFTFDAAFDDYPVWSPDGSGIVFRSARTGSGDLYLKRTNGAGVEERFVASDQTKVPNSYSTDGRFLLYQSIDPQTSADIWVTPMEGPHTPSVFLKTPFREVYGVFSPDGRWVAYQSNESGRPEVYVRPFVPPGTTSSGAVAGSQWQVSTAGGIHPVWRHDGKELYYLNPAGSMMAAPISVSGVRLEPGSPTMLFVTRVMGGGVDIQQGRQYDVTPDGRFLINTVLDSAPAPITLLMHWNPEAKK